MRITNTPRRVAMLAASTALSVGVIAAGASTASANDDDVIREGACTARSDWKLKASPENGRIEVEGEVDSNVAGQTWRWRISHDGEVVARGTSTTTARSGSFEARRVITNHPGIHTIGFRAVHRASGEICRGSVRF